MLDFNVSESNFKVIGSRRAYLHLFTSIYILHDVAKYSHHHYYNGNLLGFFHRNAMQKRRFFARLIRARQLHPVELLLLGLGRSV